ncbi:MAG: cytochrome c biogenesis protein ResB [Alistipes sp.]|nr:cytochrome c biogenesis protein ResB [Alistipes sp.]
MDYLEKISDKVRPYAGSMAAVAAAVVLGIVLQLAFGPIDYGWLRWPANLFAGIALILSVFLSSIDRTTRFFRWLSGVPLAVCLIGALTILGIVMGLTPQTAAAEPPQGIFSRLGFRSMTTSWPFALLYTFILLSLGCVTVRRLIPFRAGHYAFYLNHLGLWLLLFSAGMGAADIERHKMYVPLGGTEWRAYDNGRVMELPVAISLHNFEIEQYVPKLAVADTCTGEFLPAGKPVYLEADDHNTGRVMQWDITVEKYIHHAVPAGDTTYLGAIMPASSPAAYVRATDRVDGHSTAGWVASGNGAQSSRVLGLDGTHVLIMTRPEPKRYVSDIEVTTADGKTASALLEVNKPLNIGHWTIYQYGYDTRAGRMSEYTIVELVYDPWIVPVYVGILMLAAGSVCLIFSGAKTKGKSR